MIPSTLDEAVDMILVQMSPEVRAGWVASEDSYQARLHHGYGTGLRNHWGLWFNETPLAKWFQSNGLWHGDDRSGCILDAVHARLKGLPFSIEDEVTRYNAHWRRHGLDEKGDPIAGHIEPSWMLKLDKDGKIVSETPL